MTLQTIGFILLPMFVYPFFNAPETLQQAINPWSWWFGATANTNASDNQNGLINITTYKSENPEMEHKITHEIAGYGMQLSQIEKLLEVLIECVPDVSMGKKRAEIVSDFEEMMAKIRAEKERQAYESLSPGGIDRIIQNLEMLKNSDHELYKRAVSRLKEAL